MQSGGRRGRTRKPCLAVTPDTSGTLAGQLLPGLAGIAHPDVQVPLLRARRIGRARRNPFGDPPNASRRRPGSKPMTTQPPVSSLTLIPEPGSRTPPERENSARARGPGQSITVLSRRPIVPKHVSMPAATACAHRATHASVGQAAPITRVCAFHGWSRHAPVDVHNGSRSPGVAMCHYDEVVWSMAGSSAGRRLTGRRSSASAGASPGGACDAGGEGGDRAVNDDAAQHGRGKARR
jgi:hypothetical protein